MDVTLCYKMAVFLHVFWLTVIDEQWTFKILFKSILSTLSTSTQPKKYLKYKSKYIFSKVFKIQTVQNTAPQKVFKIQVPKYLLGG